MANGMITSRLCHRTKTRAGAPHGHDRNAMEPRCCHCSPAANGETDTPEILKALLGRMKPSSSFQVVGNLPEQRRGNSGERQSY